MTKKSLIVICRINSNILQKYFEPPNWTAPFLKKTII